MPVLREPPKPYTRINRERFRCFRKRAILNGFLQLAMAGTRAHSGTATPAHTSSSRPLVVLHPHTNTRISIIVSSANAEWTAAEVARDTFSDWLAAEEKAGTLLGFDILELDEDNENQAKDDAFEKGLVLSAYFLNHLTTLLGDLPSETSVATNSVLLSTFKYFSDTFLLDSDVHTLASSFPADIRSLVIKGFFNGRAKLEIAGLGGEISSRAEGGLLELAGKADGGVQLYALFGGQGMNEVYFDELQVSFFGQRENVRH